jgi:shikimate kinase/3-dehydroquinate synthase
MKPLLLTGPMGSGKSTVGKLVASQAGRPFIDLDQEIEARAGTSIAAIFQSQGEGAFRALERAALEDELANPSPRVVALGGGALLDPGIRRRALAETRVVGLTAPVEELRRRTQGGDRPLLKSQDLEAVLAARAAVYAETHATIANTKAPEQTALDVARAWAGRSIAVPLGLRSYTARFGSLEQTLPELLDWAKPSSLALITDARVGPLWAERALNAAGNANWLPIGPAGERFVEIPATEAGKHLGTVEAVLRALLKGGADRGTWVVALGGGVVTDVAGLIAALYFRGLRWVAIPTTLLGMVDAAVGGKTAVDLGDAKNAVGAFHQPSAVLVDRLHLTTEPARGFSSGLAEVVKTACVGDSVLFDAILSAPGGLVDRDVIAVEEAVAASISVKARVVASDEQEGGARMILNFGHTIGHAIESVGGFSRWTHGEAVALGMMEALRFGAARGATPPALVEQVGAMLASLDLPVETPPEVLVAAADRLSLDKKRRAGEIRFVFLTAKGEATLEKVPVQEVAAHCRRVPKA